MACFGERRSSVLAGYCPLDCEWPPAGASVNGANHDGWTPLMAASRYGGRNAVRRRRRSPKALRPTPRGSGLAPPAPRRATYTTHARACDLARDLEDDCIRAQWHRVSLCNACMFHTLRQVRILMMHKADATAELGASGLTALDLALQAVELPSYHPTWAHLARPRAAGAWQPR